MNRRLRKIDDLASDWVLRRESGLAPGEAGAFKAWRDADPRHGDAISRHEKAWSLLERQREAGRVPGLVRELSRRSSRRRRAGLAIAAAACAGLFATGWLWKTRRPRGGPAPAATAIVLLPEKRTLPDGSVIELRRGAEIAVDFTGTLRRVALKKGEALFEVAKNKQRPFVVSADGIEVRAVGTAFVVQLDGQKLDVMVTEGRVRVGREQATGVAGVPEPSSSADPALFLDAGNRLTVEVGGGTAAAPRETRISSREIADRLVWRAPRVEFSETPLGDAVALMNRYSAVHLLIADPILAAVRVNGLFRADDSEAFARLLEANFGVESRRSGGVITLQLDRR